MPQQIKLWSSMELPKNVVNAISYMWEDIRNGTLSKIYLNDFDEAYSVPADNGPWAVNARIIRDYFIGQGELPNAIVYVHNQW